MATNDTNMFQGSLLPETVTTKQTQQQTPQFYTNYLQDIANLGQNAVTQGGVAGFSPLQQQAFQMAPQASFAGADTLNQASNAFGGINALTGAKNVGAYMSPYIQNVMDANQLQAQQNMFRNVLPALSAAGASSGQFGSSRMANATGQSIADIQNALSAQNASLLNTGYQNAMTNAQTGATEQLQAGQGLVNAGQQQNALAKSGLDELKTLGDQQQKQGQAILDYPMLQAQNYAKLLGGYSIPTGTTEQTVAPGQQGMFTNSPLSQIAGLGSLIAALYGQGSVPK